MANLNNRKIVFKICLKIRPPLGMRGNEEEEGDEINSKIIIIQLLASEQEYSVALSNVFYLKIQSTFVA